jgi:mono/diheme cytochrome c family protein
MEWMPCGQLDGGVMKRALLVVMLVACARAEAQPPNPLVVDNCLACHTEDMLAQQRLTAKQWTAVIKKMQGWGTPIEDGQVDMLVKDLAARFGLDAKPYVPARIDAADADATFAPLPDGKWKGGNARRGKPVYEKNCASCHGADGHGSPTGTNLADRPLLFRATEFVAPVRSGRGRMPAYDTQLLKDADLASILAYLRTL